MRFLHVASKKDEAIKAVLEACLATLGWQATVVAGACIHQHGGTYEVPTHKNARRLSVCNRL